MTPKEALQLIASLHEEIDELIGTRSGITAQIKSRRDRIRSLSNEYPQMDLFDRPDEADRDHEQPRSNGAAVIDATWDQAANDPTAASAPVRAPKRRGRAPRDPLPDRVRDAVARIEATTDRKDLQRWKRAETRRDKPRPGVVKALDARLKATRGRPGRRPRRGSGGGADEGWPDSPV